MAEADAAVSVHSWLPPREAAIAQMIDRVWCKTPGSHWSEDAAVLVVSSGDVRDGLRLLDRIRSEHVPVRRRPGSNDIICKKCQVGWVCEYAELAGQPTGGN